VSLLRVIATIARMTTTSSAAAMTTAAVGLSPKIVVRSEVTVRGRAAPSSLFAELSLLRVSLRVVLERSEVAADPPGVDGELVPESFGSVTVPLAEPDGEETEPLAEPLPEPDGALWVLLVLLWAMAPPTRPRVMIAMRRRTATLFMLHLLRGLLATAVPPDDAWQH
jgi:hypothetical protein